MHLTLQLKALPLSQISVSFVSRQSSLSSLMYTYLLTKCFSLTLLWYFSLPCSDCRLRCYRLALYGKICFEAGTLHTVDKNRAIQLCCWWISRSTRHNHRIHVFVLRGNQLLHSVTLINFDSSPLDTQMNTTEQFTRYKLRDARGRTMYLPHYTRTLYHCVKSPRVS